MKKNSKTADREAEWAQPRRTPWELFSNTVGLCSRVGWENAIQERLSDYGLGVTWGSPQRRIEVLTPGTCACDLEKAATAAETGEEEVTLG